MINVQAYKLSLIPRKQFCFKKCGTVWLFDCNRLSENFSLSYIIRRSDFQAKILKEIHNKHYGLQEYNIHALSISIVADKFSAIKQNRQIFSYFCKISTNATVEFANRYSLKNTNFYRHYFFGTVLAVALGLFSYLEKKNINLMIIFISYFP